MSFISWVVLGANGQSVASSNRLSLFFLREAFRPLGVGLSIVLLVTERDSADDGLDSAADGLNAGADELDLGVEGFDSEFSRHRSIHRVYQRLKRMHYWR